jgi:branched-chain amino acid transport system substrate-binding protein
MDQKSIMTYAVLLVVGCVIGLGVGSMLLPSDSETETQELYIEVNPIDGETIRIGATTAGLNELEISQPLFDEIITQDINDYCEKLGYDVSFEYLLDQCDYSATVGLEKVQAYKAMGVNMMVGHQWSGQCEASLSYANENDFLMLSHCSTSPLLAIADDNLFRLCPNDLAMAPAMDSSLWSFGIEAIVVFQVGDTWGDGIWNAFEPLWESHGVVIERCRYPTETAEFSTYLEVINSAVTNAIDTYGVEHVAVQTIALGELPTLLTQAADYPNLMSVRWFGTESAGRDTKVLEQCPEIGLQLGLWSPLAAPAYSTMWTEVESRLYDNTGLWMGFYEGCQYDSAWILALDVLQSGSTDATDIIPLIPSTANHFFGATGWCLLDDTGDRSPPNYDIWGYVPNTDGTVGFTRYGVWSPVTGDVAWDTSLVTPVGH